LLQQRIWIRDRSAQAALAELDRAATSMSDARDRLQPLLLALNQAQRALDNAMREHIPGEFPAGPADAAEHPAQPD